MTLESRLPPLPPTESLDLGMDEDDTQSTALWVGVGGDFLKTDSATQE